MRPEARHVECKILRKKSLLPFLEIRLIYYYYGPNKLNKIDQSASAEGEGEALRRLEGGPPAPIDLSIPRTLSLFLAMPRHHSVPLALSHHYSVPHAQPYNLWPLQEPSHSLPLFLAISGHKRSLSLPPALPSYFWPLHGSSRSLPLLLTISGHHTAPLTPSRYFSLFLVIARPL